MKCRHTILLLMVLVCGPVCVQAQNPWLPWLDSLKRQAAVQKDDSNKVWILKTIADYYSQNDPDSSLLYAKQGLALAEKLQYTSGIFWSIQALHYGLHVKGNFLEQVNYALKAWPLADKLKDNYSYGWRNGMMADSYISIGDYVSAMYYIRIVINNISQYYHNELFSAYYVIVPVYIGLHQYDSALISARRALAMLKEQPALYASEANEGQFTKAFAFMYLGQAFAANATYDSALYYYRKSLPYSLGTSMKVAIIDNYNGIAEVFKAQEKYDSSITYAQMALKEKFTNSYSAGKLKATAMLADIYEKKSRADSSLKYLRIYANLKDSIYSQEKIGAFQSALLKDKEKQADVQAATAELKNRYVIYWLATGFAVLVIVIGVYIHTRRIKQLQIIRNSIADDLHDDIGSTLSSISIMSELAKTSSAQSANLLNSIGESTIAIQENMSDIVWAVNPDNDQFENVLQRMNLFATDIADAGNIQLGFNSNETLLGKKLSMKQRKNLYLFFKEAVNNAVKHSGAKKILVDICRKNQHLEMSIADNGNGFNSSELMNGNGLGSLKRRAEELNAFYEVKSVIGGGTNIQLKFKIG